MGGRKTWLKRPGVATDRSAFRSPVGFAHKSRPDPNLWGTLESHFLILVILGSRFVQNSSP